MTVAELKKVLVSFEDDAEVVTLRILRDGRTPEKIDAVYSGLTFANYDEDFVGKVVLW